MSLDVSEDLLAKAQAGEVTDADFIDCIKQSLPFAWELIAKVVNDLKNGVVSSSGSAQFADNTTPPPDEQSRGQLLRVLASDAMRNALERHYGVKLAFENCHRVAAFPLSEVDSDTYRNFISPRGQLLNQSPELRDC
ncbi:SCO5389 family protein [Glycomyces luteolus]|uniref:SCO5389 family protein n=1 Tax=Glycomyces luteolus TaxID=2670330 RepID=A0A9X3P737_9ACTN|nr:SCO5389 family protein [Glycomyces luteolus]MDA1358163.1 SCO5389 family protein [Glycomyces luteolus]